MVDATGSAEAVVAMALAAPEESAEEDPAGDAVEEEAATAAPAPGPADLRATLYHPCLSTVKV